MGSHHWNGQVPSTNDTQLNSDFDALAGFDPSVWGVDMDSLFDINDASHLSQADTTIAPDSMNPPACVSSYSVVPSDSALTAVPSQDPNNLWTDFGLENQNNAGDVFEFGRSSQVNFLPNYNASGFSEPAKFAAWPYNDMFGVSENVLNYDFSADLFQDQIPVAPAASQATQVNIDPSLLSYDGSAPPPSAQDQSVLFEYLGNQYPPLDLPASHAPYYALSDTFLPQSANFDDNFSIFGNSQASGTTPFANSDEVFNPEPRPRHRKTQAEARPCARTETDYRSQDFSRPGRRRYRKHPFAAEKPRNDKNRSWVRINDSTAGSVRSGKINQYDPTEHGGYKQQPHPIGNWEAYGAKFAYTGNGELTEATYSIEDIQKFIYRHPNPGDSNLIMWIQRTPADSARRYPSQMSAKCRFEDCPGNIFSRSIGVGLYRIAFDDQWSKWGDTRDPLMVAGYVHLYCMEKFLDFPEICQHFDVRADDRKIAREPCGDFRARLEWAEQEVAKDFVHRCKNGTIASKYPGYPVHSLYHRGQKKEHDSTLVCAMSKAKVATTVPAKRKALEARGCRESHFSVHLGDLDRQVRSRAADNERRRAKIRGDIESEDEDDNHVVDSHLPSPVPSKEPRHKTFKNSQSANRGRKRSHQEADTSQEDDFSDYKGPTGGSRSKRINRKESTPVRRSARLSLSSIEPAEETTYFKAPTAQMVPRPQKSTDSNSQAAPPIPWGSKPTASVAPTVDTYSDDSELSDVGESLVDFSPKF